MKTGLVITALMLAVVAPAQTAKKMSKADWQKLYDQAEKYFEKEDVNGLFSSMTPNFTMTSMGQTMNLKQSKEGLKQFFSMVEGLKCEFNVTKFTQNGNSATVTQKYNNVGRMMNPATKKMGKFTDQGSETLTFVYTKGKWMVKKIVVNESKMTLDGKPFMPGM